MKFKKFKMKTNKLNLEKRTKKEIIFWRRLKYKNPSNHFIFEGWPEDPMGSELSWLYKLPISNKRFLFEDYDIKETVDKLFEAMKKANPEIYENINDSEGKFKQAFIKTIIDENKESISLHNPEIRSRVLGFCRTVGRHVTKGFDLTKLDLEEGYVEFSKEFRDYNIVANTFFGFVNDKLERINPMCNDGTKNGRIISTSFLYPVESFEKNKITGLYTPKKTELDFEVMYYTHAIKYHLFSEVLKNQLHYERSDWNENSGAYRYQGNKVNLEQFLKVPSYANPNAVIFQGFLDVTDIDSVAKKLNEFVSYVDKNKDLLENSYKKYKLISELHQSLNNINKSMPELKQNLEGTINFTENTYKSDLDEFKKYCPKLNVVVPYFD